jgi:hypothetical protein
MACPLPFSSPLFATECRLATQALAAPSDGLSVPRSRVLDELAELYLRYLNREVAKEVYTQLVAEQAFREGNSQEKLQSEIEFRAEALVTHRKAASAFQKAVAQSEENFMYGGFLPYLEELSERDRREVHSKLFIPKKVKPVSTGEVQLKFEGVYTSPIGKENGDGEPYGGVTTVRVDESYAFAIGQVPVTQLLFLLAYLNDPAIRLSPLDLPTGSESVELRLSGVSYWIQPNHPMVNIDAGETLAHIESANRIMGTRYALPSENQWEIAARAGSPGLYHFGDDVNLLPLYGWTKENSQGELKAVAEREPNPWGIYDAYGNVLERTRLVGNASVLRGGSFLTVAQLARSGRRYFREAGIIDPSIGFRMIRTTGSRVPPVRTVTLGDSLKSK